MNDAKRRYSSVTGAAQGFRDVGNGNAGSVDARNQPIWTEMI
jgi:hypothetical protein